MKKLIFPIVLIFMTSVVFCQKNDKIIITPEKYLERSQLHSAGGWLLLAGGFTVLVATVMPAFSWETNVKPFRPVPTTIGAAMIAGSIPLFISSDNNKHKSLTISLKKEIIPSIAPNAMMNNKVPSVSLSIRL